MNLGLYNAFLGMRARQRALDTTANNIANASTTGFKGDALVYSSIEQVANAGTVNNPNAVAGNLTLIRDRAVTGVLASNATNYASGSIQNTGRGLDIALNGDGFFAVQTPAGERYTRAGDLTINADGQLVTQNGHLVIGERGPITLPPGEPSFSEDGTLTVNGRTIDRLKLVRFDNPRAALLKEGSSLYVATGTEQPVAATNNLRVIGGALETSNVNVMTEMAAMMQTSREFESLQKSVSTMMNDLGRKISTEIGRL